MRPSCPRLLALLILALTACQAGPGSPAPLPTSETTLAGPYSPTAPIALLTPSLTPRPTWTKNPHPSTSTPGPTTIPRTPDLSWQETEIAYDLTITAVSRTAVPIPVTSNFLSDLEQLGYTQYFGTSTLGPGGYTYSVFIFLDSAFWYEGVGNHTPTPYPSTAWREDLDTPGCRIVFYRWNGTENELLFSFPAAQYPEGAVYAGNPVFCRPAFWTGSPTPNQDFGYGSRDSELIAPLWNPNLNSSLFLGGPWSDFNQNGLPEFSVTYQYCPNACVDSGAWALQIFEIQSTSRIVEITADLPGVIEPIYLLHSNDPLEFLVFDPRLEYCYHWCIIETWWIYAWDGKKLVDVTPQHADLIRQVGQVVVRRVQERYGEPIGEWHLLEILFLYEKAGMRDEALDIFLEISDLSHWPPDDQNFLCWLQIARAWIQEEHRLGRPFSFPPIEMDGYVEFDVALDYAIKKVDASRYDLTVCQGLLP